MKTVAIHQPEYFPILGYAHKALNCDVFVLLDDVQFSRSSLQQRAKIADAATAWVSIPFVHNFPELISEVKIVSDKKWWADHRQAFRAAYWQAPKFGAIRDLVDAYFSAMERVHPHRLVDAVSASVERVFNWLDVGTEVVRASALDAAGKKGDRVLDICRQLKATHYLSGKTGAGYLDRGEFQRAGVEIVVQDFSMPVYRLGQPDPAGAGRGLSALDALAHLGRDETSKLIRRVK